MKKLIYLILFVALCVGLYTYLKSYNAKKIDRDYEKIETVRKAVEELVATSTVNTISSNRGQWYIFDLRAVKDHDEEFYVKLGEKLGKDFDSRLSNGDYLFVGVYPIGGSYRIYAGDPATSNTMLYPDWEYKKLDKK